MRTKREVICSQQQHCLSCPLSVAVTGKDCRKLTLQEIGEGRTMTDVLCDCNCRYSSPDGKCVLECINMDNYGRCAEFEEPDRRESDETSD